MESNSTISSAYQEIAPLCPKGHVVLVKSTSNGQLYVKKTLKNCKPDIFYHLKKHPIPNTPTIYEIEDNHGELVIIEEYLPGNTLAERIEQDGFLSEKDTIQIALQLCKILSDLHHLSSAVIHRDIKPSNILISPDNKIKLLDFNAAKLQTSGSSRDTVLLGTEGYAAPEQYGFSASSHQTDIYAMGILINVCLKGTLPGQDITNGALQKVIRRCTALDPKDRYQDTRELAHALKKSESNKNRMASSGFSYSSSPENALRFGILPDICLLHFLKYADTL